MVPNRDISFEPIDHLDTQRGQLSNRFVDYVIPKTIACGLRPIPFELQQPVHDLLAASLIGRCLSTAFGISPLAAPRRLEVGARSTHADSPQKLKYQTALRRQLDVSDARLFLDDHSR